MNEKLQLLLCDINPEVTAAWREAFKGVPVRIYNGDFRTLPKAYPDENFFLTTAGNSYGIMGGGLDLAVARYFPGIEQEIRENVATNYYGEIPVGTSALLMLHHRNRPFIGVVYAPTMRSPSRIDGTDNVYVVMKNILRHFTTFNETVIIQGGYTLVLPGFGGSCGLVRPGVLAASMRLAYDIHYDMPTPKTHIEMYKRDQLIRAVSKGFVPWPSKV